MSKSNKRKVESVSSRIYKCMKNIDENRQYIRESFSGIFPIGKTMKKYENNFIDNFASSISKNYSTLPCALQEQINKNNKKIDELRQEYDNITVVSSLSKQSVETIYNIYNLQQYDFINFSF